MRLHGSYICLRSMIMLLHYCASYIDWKSHVYGLEAGGTHLQVSWQLSSLLPCDKLHHPAESEFQKCLQSASSLSLSVHCNRQSTYSDWAFAVFAWNNLPQHVITASSLPIFFCRLDTHFLASLLGRLLRVDLITLVGLKCPSVRMSLRPQKVSLISMKFGM